VIRIELNDDDLAHTRLALSPLWELVASLFLLHKPDPPAEHAPWIAQTRAALRGVELGPLDPAIPLARFVPDFVAPIPVDPVPSLADEAVLEQLHPRVRWRRPVIELDKKGDLDMRLDGQPLVLVPLVFASGVLIASQTEAEGIGIGYQARGTAALWAPEASGDDKRLELLLGHGRAAVLRALTEPATTTELARRLSYAPSTVSAHLDVLARAGILERHRVRRSVFYVLNETGQSLVALLLQRPAALSA
jgi:DNA-binding MarR family transcriptional regulator